MRDYTINQVRQIIAPYLQKVGEVRTYEVWYKCKKSGLELSYKAAGQALREIMDHLVSNGIAEKIKLGQWYISRPELITSTHHPIDDELVQKKEMLDKCESVRQQMKGKHTDSLFELCAANGVTIKTFCNYMNYIKNKRA